MFEKLNFCLKPFIGNRFKAKMIYKSKLKNKPKTARTTSKDVYLNYSLFHNINNLF